MKKAMCLTAILILGCTHSVAELSKSEIQSASKMSFCVSDIQTSHNSNPQIADDISVLDEIDNNNCDETVKIPYRRTKALNQTYNAVKTGVIVVHGNRGDVDNTFNFMQDALDSIPAYNDEYLIIAPAFLDAENYSATDYVDDIIYWGGNTSGNWRFTGHSTLPSTVQLSSSQVMDAIVLKIRAVAPNLETIVVVGYSAGGQMVQRYALTNQLDDGSLQNISVGSGNIEFRYVIASPGSYMYLSSDRYKLSDRNNLVKYTSQEISDAIADNSACSTYNVGRYGIENKTYYPYIASVGSDTEAFVNNIKNRRILIIAGDEDDKTESDAANDSCNKRLQGEGRLERSYNYMYHIGREGAAKNTSYCTVAGATHNKKSIVLKSEPVVRFIEHGFTLCGTEELSVTL